MLDNYLEPEDILSDESFLAWYFKAGSEQELNWESWMVAHPERKDLVNQAVEMLNATRIPEKPVPQQQKLRAEETLMRRIASLPDHHPASLPAAEHSQSSFIYRYRWIAAASVLILLAAGWYISENILHTKPEIRTQFGQIGKHELPDGTEVVMNANSKLNYSSGWKDDKDREVWLNGEAFFHVAKTPEKSRFIVHTSRFDVIVTGTQFNVVDRHNKASVMLQEGSVIVHLQNGKELHLVPGELAEFNNEQLKKRPARKDSAVAWKEQKLVFDKTPLKEIATIITDQYGIPVKLGDDSVGEKTVCGILPNNNLQVLIQALEATSDFDLNYSDKEIVIRSARFH